MTERPHLRLLVVVLLATLGSTLGARRAHGGTIPLFTGSWQMESDDGGRFQDQSVSTLTGPLNSTFFGSFGYSPLISNYSEQGSRCSSGESCFVTWSGIFTGGTVMFAAGNGQADVSDYFFTGQITGGSFAGLLNCSPDECLGENRATISFISTSTETWFGNPFLRATDVWSSQGTWSGSNCVGSCGPRVFGTLTLTTSTVPEPGSMALLGAGIGAFAVRKRPKGTRRTRLRSTPPSGS